MQIPAPEALRCFVAIEMPASVLQAMDRLRRQIQQQAKDQHEDRELAGSARWVRPDNMHLTLKFLGAVPARLIPSIEVALARVAQAFGPIHLNLDGVGVFPNLRRARVLWAGFGGDITPLLELQAAIEQEMAALGYPKEPRPFHPHLTLTRLEAGLPVSLARWLETSPPKVPVLPITGDGIILMRSELRPGGPRYTPLATIRLASAGAETARTEAG